MFLRGPSESEGDGAPVAVPMFGSARGAPCATCGAGPAAPGESGCGCPGGTAATKSPPSLRSSDLRSGSTIDRGVSAPFERSYGASLRDVRIHEGSALPRQFGWDALTLGNDVAFAPGQYRPDTRDGLALIGHELAHVVQQRRGGMRMQAAGAHTDAAEREAWSASEAALSGRPASLGGAPLQMAGGSAGGCFMPGMPGNVVGMLAHLHIQKYYNAAGIYSEVTVPGVGAADLVWATLPPAVPVGQVSGIQPPGYLTSPPHSPPAACAVGEIKPISEMATGGGVAQNLAYITGLNAYYGVNNTGPLLGVMPGALVTGDPTFIAWPPQMLHMVPGPLGVYYYFCRPMGELLPIMEYLRELLDKWLKDLKKLLEERPDLGPILEPVLEPVYRLARAIARALEAAGQAAWDHFWEILLAIVVIALIALFFAEIIAAIAAVLAAIAELLTALEALLALAAALLVLLGISPEASAQEPEPPPENQPREPPPELPTPDPGCFPYEVPVLMADGTTAPLGSLTVGAEVVAWDEAANELRPCRVGYVHHHPPEPLLELVLSNGRTLVVTRFHTLRAPDRWVVANEVVVGDELLTAVDGLGTTAVVSIRESVRWEPVYNLSVPECPTFVSDGVVVHNTGMFKPSRVPTPEPIERQ